ncbi:carbohydrate-binding protein [Salininema proteolyticum]|uniref:Carbohydrate-binding protein n=1 Tax=Salininema proteolyticum TaxID=1607685 RepID=A0ABV8U185_9ACTN
MRLRTTLAVLSAGVVTASGVSALAAGESASAQEAITFDSARDDLSANADPAMVEALAEHLDTDRSTVLDRLATADVGSYLERTLPAELGDSYAGTWLDDSATTVMIATTDAAEADAIEGAGAEAVVVDHSLATLDTWKSDLDAAAAVEVSDDVHSWMVDAVDNEVSVTASTEEAAQDLIDRAGVPAEAVTVDVRQLDLEPLQDIRGGEAYLISGSRCSVGFSSTHPTHGDGFTTAGHCGSVGTPITGGTGSGGAFRDSTFPGRDVAWVEAGSGWEAAPVVYGWGQGDRQVTDGNEAPLGADVCRSGSTTQFQCGTIDGKNESVNYPQGTVSGLTRSSACAEPGDSGGAFISGTSAQGQTSGGQTGCPGPGPIWFSTVTEALSSAGATLTTSGGTEEGFTLSLDPSSVAIDPGSSESVTLDAETISGSAQDLTLSATGAPTGVSVSFESERITSDGSTKVSVDVASSVGEGTHSITVTGTGSTTATATLTLTVGDGGGEPGGTWEPYTPYSVGDTVTYGGSEYRCRIAHTSLPGWEPPNAGALWVEI